MVAETQKSNRNRSHEYFQKYCQGNLLDIGGGDSPLTPSAKVFDVEDGDAQNILNYLEPESYDCVYSSHCLEHMSDVEKALRQWWSLVKPNGYLIIVVPDEDLYEQGLWPSDLNSDHKYTFTISKGISWSPVSVNLKQLVDSLDHSELVSIKLQDDAYDYNLQYKLFSPFQYSLWDYRSSQGLKALLKHLVYKMLYYPVYVWSENTTGRVIDQTAGPALAQIEVIVKKLK